ncbi:type II secretion system protein N [Psychromonas sp. CNPT3]|uniref:type II secretion system protein N n=1 Tax=Psychromonas sp. CNPT3 TaxID=314282 RepID=UPI00006E705C|nr:type II secretion system protein N [Psychromonas sp. CNPT3]AGH80131.1 type II secretion system protein N [Psychromonas sp. CNPT3]
MKIKCIVFFVAVYLLSLIWTLPASMIQPFLAQNGPVKIQAFSGTIWQGSAKNISYQNNYQLSNVQWSVNWRTLWTLALSLDVTFNNDAPRLQGKGELVADMNTLHLNQFEVNLKAADVSSYIASPIPIEAQGKIRLMINTVAIASLSCQQLDGYLVWRKAALNSVMGNINLANVEIDLSCVNQRLIAKVQQVSTDLKTQLQAELQNNGSYQLRGTIKDGPTLPKNIQEGLSWLGPKGADGKIAFSYNGRL